MFYHIAMNSVRNDTQWNLEDNFVRVQEFNVPWNPDLRSLNDSKWSSFENCDHLHEDRINEPRDLKFQVIISNIKWYVLIHDDFWELMSFWVRLTKKLWHIIFILQIIPRGAFRRLYTSTNLISHDKIPFHGTMKYTKNSLCQFHQTVDRFVIDCSTSVVWLVVGKYKFAINVRTCQPSVSTRSYCLTWTINHFELYWVAAEIVCS